MKLIYLEVSILFKQIDIDSKQVLDKYFELVDYEAYEYCFTTLYMWKELYNTKYYLEKILL